MTSGAAGAHSGPNRRTMLTWIVGAGAVVATPTGIAAFLARADSAATAAAASGWSTFDGFVHDIGLAFSADAVTELAKKGVTAVQSALQTTEPSTYHVLPHAAVHKPSGSITFPVAPVGQPELSKLVYVMTPAGDLIDFLPRATQSLAKVSEKLQQRHGITAAVASEYLMPVTAAQDMGNPPSDQAIEFGTMRGSVQVFNQRAGAGSEEIVTVTALSESWVFPVAAGSVDLV